jgi:hypothetical protein
MLSRILILVTCIALGFASAPRPSWADLPAVPDRMAWVTVPDRTEESMRYAAAQLARVAHRHGMHCFDIVSGGIRCDLDSGIGGSFIAGASENGYEIQLFFGEMGEGGRPNGQATLSAVLDDYAKRMRGRKQVGEVIRCRSPFSWTHDARGASICEK